MNNNHYPTCEERWKEAKDSRIMDLRILANLYRKDPDAHDPDLGRLDEYGLCFDYVEPGTFQDQEQGYFVYQISWGGPSDEFRFFINNLDYPEVQEPEIEYWFLDWNDGYGQRLEGPDYDFMLRIWRYLISAYPLIFQKGMTF